MSGCVMKFTDEKCVKRQYKYIYNYFTSIEQTSAADYGNVDVGCSQGDTEHEKFIFVNDF